MIFKFSLKIWFESFIVEVVVYFLVLFSFKSISLAQSPLRTASLIFLYDASLDSSWPVASYFFSLLILNLLALRLSSRLPLMACFVSLVLNLLQTLCRLAIRFLYLLCAFHECLNLAILDDLAFSVHFTHSGIFLLWIVVDDGLIATPWLFFAGVKLAGLGLGQVLNHVAHLAEELVFLIFVSVKG